MRADHLVIALATPLGTALLYFLLAGEIGWSEAVAGVPVAIIASAYALMLGRSGSVPMRLRARGLSALLRACGAVLPDGWRVGRGLLRAVWRRPDAALGVIAHVPFRFGGPGPDDIGRRAAVVAAISLAPNGFALGMDRERDEMIVHQLVPDPIGGDREWPS